MYFPLFEGGSEQARRALAYVEAVRTRACSGGTGETLPVDFDHSLWTRHAQVAVRMANLLTKVIIRNNNTFPRSIEEDLFSLVRNNVDGNTLLFGSAIAVEEYVFPKYRLFCPYAYEKDRVYAHDISLNYDYLNNSTEWYHKLRMKSWATTHVSENFVTYR